jgi:hypothetical protein
VEEVMEVTQADLDRTDADTRDHIGKVQARLQEAISALTIRAAHHDESKLQEPERSGYAALQLRLSDAVYGTDEYRARLAECQDTIRHHYAANDHHPEHYPGGIASMSLLSLIEMLCDWKAAGERTKEGNMRQSLDVNRRRFGPDDMLYGILENTARELGWIE